MIDRDSLNEATRVSVFMNGLVESPSRSDLFRRIPKTFEEAVKIALKEEFSQASAQGMSAGFHNAKRIMCPLRPRRSNGPASNAVSLVTLRVTVHAAGARPANNKRRRVTQRLRLKDKRSRRVTLEDPQVRREARTVG
ncbi:unnamed protein product [Aphanomyces euteiches]